MADPNPVRLELNPDRIPRTWTREQWREVHRWLRECSRRVTDAITRSENPS